MRAPRLRAADFLRIRDKHEHARVTFIELFFDLVFVFAVTRLAHGLIGNILFKRTMTSHMALSHLVGLGLLILLIPAALFATPLVLSAATTSVLVVVAIWERRSLRSLRTH